MTSAPQPNGALAVTTTTEVTATVPVPDRSVTTAEPRYCLYTDTWCRCDVADVDTASMSVCVRHFLDVESVPS